MQSRTNNDPPAPYQSTAEDAMDEDQPTDEYDQDMLDNEDDLPQIKLLPGSTPTAASFEVQNEGHTLGNALRYVIMKNPDIEFCAYAIPHPSEAKLNMRIQTYEGTTAIEALRKGLKDLQNLCDVVAEKFTATNAEFKNKMSE